ALPICAWLLVRSPMHWPFALTAAISIASKYVFRFRGRHIWNPTNFGVVVMLMIASDSMAILSIQWGSNMWAMLAIWLVGVLTIIKVRKFHICAVYVLSFLFFAWILSLMGDGGFLVASAPRPGPRYLLSTLFMI